MDLIDKLPHLNAVWNTASAALLVTGFYFIKQKKVTPHKTCMLSAFAASLFFLAGYLTYHHYHGTTRFPGIGGIRTVYFSILISHTILAIVNLPMVLTTFYFALTGKFQRHKRLARWTFPVWLYVSVTGVLVYFFLYHWFPAA